MSKKSLKDPSDRLGIRPTSYLTEYQIGPLDKSDDTYKFESIVKQLINESNTREEDRALKLKIEQEKIKIYGSASIASKSGIENIQFEGEDLGQLMSKVNFNHLSFDNRAIDTFCDAPWPETDWVSVPKPELPDINPGSALESLRNGELMALKFYTFKGDGAMNHILRNAEISPNHRMSDEYYRTVVMCTAIAAHGLNKMPDVDLPLVFRGQESAIIGQDFVEQQKVNYNHGFISASSSYKVARKFGDNLFMYQNVRGKDISSISHFPEELEYLIPPSTQLRYTGRQQQADKTVYVLEGANVLLENEFTQISSLLEEGMTPKEKANTINSALQEKRIDEATLLRLMATKPEDVIPAIMDEHINSQLMQNEIGRNIVDLAQIYNQNAGDANAHERETFNQLTSCGAINLLTSGVKVSDMKALYDELDQPKFLACTSITASIMHNKGLKFEELKAKSQQNINYWTSLDMVALCNDVNLKNQMDKTALTLAVDNGHTELAINQIDAGADLNLKDESGRTHLMLAVVNDHTELAIKLVDAGANLDTQDNYGDTALIIASRSNQTDIVKKLINAGAKLDTQDNYGDTALKIAEWNVNTEIADIIHKAQEAQNKVRENKGKVLQALLNKPITLRRADSDAHARSGALEKPKINPDQKQR